MIVLDPTQEGQKHKIEAQQVKQNNGLYIQNLGQKLYYVVYLQAKSFMTCNMPNCC